MMSAAPTDEDKTLQKKISDGLNRAMMEKAYKHLTTSGLELPMIASTAVLDSMQYDFTEIDHMCTIQRRTEFGSGSKIQFLNDKIGSGLLALNMACTMVTRMYFPKEHIMSEYNLETRIATLKQAGEFTADPEEFALEYFNVFSDDEQEEEYVEEEDVEMPKGFKIFSGYHKSDGRIIDAGKDISLPEGKNVILTVGSSRRDPIEPKDIKSLIMLAEHFGHKVAFRLPTDPVANERCKGFLRNFEYTEQSGIYKKKKEDHAPPKRWHELTAGPENWAKVTRLARFILNNAANNIAAPGKYRTVGEWLQALEPHTWAERGAVEQINADEMDDIKSVPSFTGPDLTSSYELSEAAMDEIVGISKETNQVRLQAIAVKKGWAVDHAKAMAIYPGKDLPAGLRKEFHALSKILKTHPDPKQIANKCLEHIADFVDKTGAHDVNPEYVLLNYFAKRQTVWRFSQAPNTWVTRERVKNYPVEELPADLDTYIGHFRVLEEEGRLDQAVEIPTPEPRDEETEEIW